MRPLFGARHQKGRRTGVILGNASNGMRVAILGRLMLHAIASEAFFGAQCHGFTADHVREGSRFCYQDVLQEELYATACYT
jgi:hypothetical protein